MQQVIMYECDICKEHYNSPDECIKCESIGKERSLANKGKQIKYFVEVGGGFSHWIDAYVAKVTQYKHWNKYLIKTFDCNGRKYVVNELFGNSEFKRKCRSVFKES